MDTLSYHVYMIRAWSEQNCHDTQKVVRFMLEWPATGERHGFVSLEVLLDALYRELDPMRNTALLTHCDE